MVFAVVECCRRELLILLMHATQPMEGTSTVTTASRAGVFAAAPPSIIIREVACCDLYLFQTCRPSGINEIDASMQDVKIQRRTDEAVVRVGKERMVDARE
mmetsp:Transcript_27698/g.42630  ORF Transcript_27698/g.42630 Transcript_27698/m.42630 type:complete len:101 (+) Transcript_27698:408-710(+)